MAAVQAPNLDPSPEYWMGDLHVTRVRLVLGASATEAYVEGRRRRRRVVARVALARATEISASGVPVTLEHRA
jgi:hypothetical protein